MGEPQQWRSSERHYTLTSSTFTKRELRQDELPVSKRTGQKVQPRWSRERLENEAATLKFIAAKTSIPTPEFLGLYEEDSLLHLRTNRVIGVSLDEIKEADAAKAVAHVEEYLTSYILPQLRALRHNTIGSVDEGLPLVPPSRITCRDKRSCWSRKSSLEQEFVFCHNDLSQHNIFVDPGTFDITAIIDWEFAGFFPIKFEIPFWRQPWNKQIIDDSHTDELIRLLDSPGKNPDVT